MNTVDIKVQGRDTEVKASTLRADGKIPAVLYGGDINIPFVTTHNDVKAVIYTGDFKIAKLDIDGKQYDAIVKDVQFHPVTDQIEHIDFLALEKGRKVKVELPIRFKGASPGVKNGGKLIQSMRKVKVKLDPNDLVDEVFIDISKLKLGFSVRVKDIEISENIEILVNPAIPVATVEVPRALKSAESQAELDEEEAVEETAEAPAEE